MKGVFFEKGCTGLTNWCGGWGQNLVLVRVYLAKGPTLSWRNRFLGYNPWPFKPQTIRPWQRTL